MARDQASERQIAAASPVDSTWLSANAGSGKTRVLTDRVARLLLNGVSPQNILCLTYTKAAASEMQNRLFKRLGEWAMKDDQDLSTALGELGVPAGQELQQARRLFARAIETPGGLRIQTIHSFCSSLLRRFPLESGVSPQFVEMDERAVKILRDEVVEGLSDGPEQSLVRDIARFYTGEDFSSLTQEITDNRAHFTQATSKDEIWGWFGLNPGFDDGALARIAFSPDDGAMLGELHPMLARGSATEMRAAKTLSSIDFSELSVSDLPVLESVFLYGAKTKAPFGAKVGAFPTGPLRKGAAAHLVSALDDMMERVAAARAKRVALFTARKTHALHRFAAGFITQYEARKQRHGWLDFDDLIEKAGALLTEPAVAAWVLYRLDGGIDHILVDEAQDTSPSQWRVVKSLAQEFTSGESAKQDVQRTLFVVGDPKQSIYSFQGADPAQFTFMRDQFGRELHQVGQQLQTLQLEYSFRSSPAILNLVDCCLETLPGLGEDFLHRAYFSEKPGRVDLWPVIAPTRHEEDRKWHDPVDRPTPQNHNVILADQIAAEIERMFAQESIADDDGNARPVQPRDIMILVRKRSGGLFTEIIRACKERALPIAGADRLRIGGELAVKDLSALLKFLATPEDDLSLAAALRSPLFGWSEQDLYGLAQGRAKGAFLWRRLSDRQDAHEDTYNTLRALRNNADFLRPYDLLERILTRYKGRENLLARLGGEAEDGIDALLSQALSYERLETPSLTGFLMWLDADEVTIKRQMDTAGNQIRVMTVHGAKGLESPVIFLPDTAKAALRPRNELVEVGEGRLAWKSPAASSPREIEDAHALQAEAEREEWARLLYVAMTRAEQWLVVAAAGDAGDENQSWYRILEAGMGKIGSNSRSFALGEGLRYETGVWAAVAPDDTTPVPPQPLPDWALGEVQPPLKPAKTLAPSELGGAKALFGDPGIEGTEAAMRRGRQIHRLLEYLPDYPSNAWPQTAASLLLSGEDAASPAEVADLLGEVSGVLTAKDLAFLFEGAALAEVDISAALPALGGARMHGAIDRLIVSDDRVLAVDFKSNALVPDTPQEAPIGLLRQMGAYASALGEVFGGKKVETAILWTKTAQLMPLPNELVMQALRHLDDPPRGS